MPKGPPVHPFLQIGWGSLFRYAGDKAYAAGDKLYPHLVNNIASNVVGI